MRPRLRVLFIALFAALHQRQYHTITSASYSGSLVVQIHLKSGAPAFRQVPRFLFTDAKRLRQIFQHTFRCQITTGKSPGEIIDAFQLLAPLIDIAVSNGISRTIQAGNAFPL